MSTIVFTPETFVTESFDLLGIRIGKNGSIPFNLQDISTIPSVGLDTGKTTRGVLPVFSGRLTATVIDGDLPGLHFERQAILFFFSYVFL
jgi:hypothetical protein